MVICKEFPNPKLFWLSVIWLVIGVPLMWAIGKIYNFVYLRIFIKSLKTNGKCKLCLQDYCNILDKKIHENCDGCTCPYCDMKCSKSSSVRLHILNCERKDEIYSENKDLISHKVDRIKQAMDTNLSYNSCKLKTYWIVFFVLFIAISCIPLSNASFTCKHSCREPCLEVNFHQKADGMMEMIHNFYGQYSATSQIIHVEAEPESKWHKPTEREPLIPKDEDGSTIKKEDSVSNEQLAEMIVNSMKLTELKHNEMSDKFTEEINHLKVRVSQLEAKFLSCPNVEEVKSDEIFPVPHEEFSVNIDPRDVKHLRFAITNIVQNMRLPSRNFNPHRNDSLNVNSGGALNIAGHAGVQISAGSGDPVISVGNSSQNIGLSHQAQNQPMSLTALKDQNEEQQVNRRRHKDKRIPKEWEREYERLSSHHKRSKREVPESFAKLKEEKIKKRQDELEKSVAENLVLHQEAKIKKFHNISYGDSTTYELKNPVQIIHTNKVKRFEKTHLDLVKFDKKSCNLECLHIPGQCKCIEDGFDSNGEFQLPWGIMTTGDIKMFSSGLVYKTVSLKSTPQDDGSVKLSGLISGEIEMYEGTAIKFSLLNENVMNKPSIVISIPKIAQVYSTKFIYYTCERQMAPEMKGVCVGECDGYCGGKFCLGSRIWTWKGCRGVACNPTWCWNTGGCCCCGLNAVCKKDSRIAAMWELKYEKTQFVVCILYNGKTQSCKLVDSTSEFSIGNMNLKFSRPLEPKSRLPKHIMTIHEIKKSSHKFAYSYTEASDILLNPEACTSARDCTHGMVGDLQFGTANCAMKFGSECYEKEDDLKKSDCYRHTYIDYEGVQMDYSCRTGSWHMCSATGMAKELDFDVLITDSEKISKEFIVKLLKTDLSKNSLLMFVTGKESSGLSAFTIEIDDIILTKKETNPSVKNMKLSGCLGCHSCTLGFKCQISFIQETEGRFLVTFDSPDPAVIMTDAAFEVEKGKNSFMIWGVSMSQIKEGDICLKYGEYEKCVKSSLILKDPEGQFVPKFENGETASVDNSAPSCTGWNIFVCAYENVKNYFLSWKKWIYYAIYGFLGLIALIIFIQLLPCFSYLLRSCFRGIKKSKNQKMHLPTKMDARILFKKLRQNKLNLSEEEKRKKDDNFITVPLFDETDF